MKTKILLTLVMVLAAALLFQIAYTMGARGALTGARGQVPHNTPAVRAPAKPGGTRQRQPVYSLAPHAAGQPDVFDGSDTRDPFAVIERMQQRMHRIFDDGFALGEPGSTLFRQAGAFEPNISIREEASRYVVKADVPGMDKDAITIEVQGRRLTISGERQEESTRQDQGFYRQELSYGSFARSIALPDDAAPDGITSSYRNGVLEIVIPKTGDTRPPAPRVKVPVT